MILPTGLELPDWAKNLTRDYDGALYANSGRMQKGLYTGEWDCPEGKSWLVDPKHDKFPFVTWRDREPYPIAKIIKDDLDNRIIKPN